MLITSCGAVAGDRTNPVWTYTRQLILKNERTHDMMFHNKEFHNHLDYHVIALTALGANKTVLDACYKDASLNLDPAIPSQGRVNDSSFHRWIGQYYRAHNDSAFLDFVDFFSGKVSASSPADVLNAYLPQFASSVACLLLHPLIELGYAYEGEVDARLTIAGLAWFATGYSPDFAHAPSGHWNSTALLDVLDALRGDPDLPPIGTPVPFVEVPQRFGHVVRKYDMNLPDDNASALAASVAVLSDAVLRLFGPGTTYDSFDLLHLVTGSRALRQLLPNVRDAAVARDLLSYMQRGVAYMYVAMGRPGPIPRGQIMDGERESLPPWDALVAQAMAVEAKRHDSHFIKMVWLCFDEARRAGHASVRGGLYQLVASKIVANFTAGRGWVHGVAGSVVFV